MSEFVEKPLGTDDTFVGSDESIPTPHPALTDVLVNYYSTALKKPQDQVARDLEAGLYPMLRQEASAKAQQSTQDTQKNRLDNLVENRGTDPEAAAEFERIRSQLDLGNHLAPDIAAIASDGTDFTGLEKRVLERVIHAQRMIDAARSERTDGFLASTGYFFDAALADMIHGPLGAVSELTGVGEGVVEGAGQLKELAFEASQLLYQDMPPEEFESTFKNILDRVADAGVFSEENPFYLESFIQMVREGGVGWESEMSRIFQVADTLSLGITAGASALGATSRTLSKIGARGSAKDLTVSTGDNLVDNALLTEGTSPTLLRPADEYFAAPELDAMRELEANNSALDAIKKYSWASLISEEQFKAKSVEWLDLIRENNKSYKRHEIDYDIKPGATGNVLGVAVLGKSGGEPYLKLAAAEKFAAKVGGEVLPQIVDGKTKYVVTKEWNIPLKGLTDPTELKEVATGFLSSIMSTTARTTVNLDAMLKRGEAQTVKSLSILGKEYKKALRATSRGEPQRVDQLLLDVRDDPLHNWRREPLTDKEFSTRYKEKYGNSVPDSTLQYYRSVRDISDVDYYINADLILREAIDNSEEMAQLDGVFYRAKKVTIEDPDEPIWNADTSRMAKYSDLDPERAVIYEIHDAAYEPPGVGKVRYVAGSEFTTRRLYHTDVMPYNVGGHRVYTDPYKFYLKQEGRKVRLAGGKEFDAKPMTFMALRLEDEARQAAVQFNNIAEAVAKGLPTAQLDNIILANNAWNLNIEDFADLKRFGDDYNVDIGKQITWSPDQEPLIGEAFAGERTVGNAFRSGLNASKKRGSRPLLGYGGVDLDTLDPTKAIERGFAQTVAKLGDKRYLYNAINGWLKAAEREGAILNRNDLVGFSPKQKLQRAQLSPLTKVGQALSQERNTIQHRLSNTTAQVAKEQEVLRTMADFVYGKGNKTLGKSLDWMSTKDPAGFIRSIAFHSKLGMFAVEQVYVQASQLINVVGITQATLGATGAIRGMLAVMPLRLALVKQIPPQALERIAKLQAPFTGISAEDFVLLRDWIESTGRNVINRTAIEENNAAASLVTNRFLDYGQTFFNEGELMARLGAAATNLKERRLKYPNEDIFSQVTTDRMLHRQDVLTASMTSASGAPWQKSLMAVPLQFTTYHVRMAEQIFTNQILTGKERRRLALTHLMTYGAASVPAAGYLQDKLGYKGAVDPSTGLYDAVRFGAMDTILTLVSGEETALSSRLAVGEGLFDLFSGLNEDSLFETAIGPGGTIGLDFVKAFNGMLNNVFLGRFDHLSYDWNRFARNVTAYDRAYTLWMGQRYGMYISRKTEAPMIDDMSTVDVLLKGMGIPLAEQELLWTTVNNSLSDRQMLKKTIKEITRLDNIASRLLNDGDVDGASNMMEDIGAMLSVLTPSEQSKALLELRKTMSIHESVVKYLIRDGNLELANKLKEYVE